MAGVFNEMTINWEGGSYTFTPSNRLLRRIEGELSPSSLTDVARRMNEGKPPISETAYIISEFLSAAGADKSVADEDKIYAGIMNDFATNNGTGFIGLCKALLMAISPADDTAKKPTAASASGLSGSGAAVPKRSKGQSKKAK
jgi:hypothetical protein